MILECKSCLCWVPFSETHKPLEHLEPADRDQGFCHRYPDRVMRGPDDWCFEYRCDCTYKHGVCTNCDRTEPT
jgi:hypothetical protein